VATKRISQLETISDALVTGEAVLPIVISDPLIPNRKAKVNQLFRGLSAGSATAPGLAFDLDRDSGIYQSAVDEIGLSFGTAALYNSRRANTDGSSTLIIRAIDSASATSSVEITPQGSGYMTVNGDFVQTDTQFYLSGDQNPAKRAHFNVDTISTQSGTRRFDLPNVGVNTSTTIVANDTFQTLTNKTILIKDAELQITGSSETSKIAKFEVDAWESPGSHTYKLPDFGASNTQSTLLDDITDQNVFNKNMVNPTFSNTPSNDENNPTRYVIFDQSGLTQDRNVVWPDLNIKVVGEESAQTVSNKVFKGAVFCDVDPSDGEGRKINFDLSNIEDNQTYTFSFPDNEPTAPLNNGTDPNMLVSEKKTQTLTNKTMELMKINNPNNLNGVVTVDASNIEGSVSIQFPNADATLLSTNNISDVAISFGGALAAPVLGGQIRLQQHFMSGW
jgi:hypothetical protein|tara:strand:+ start:257 stop:1600 length:1344 start_codon:yes stop_codon:yes gene_type:complete